MRDINGKIKWKKKKNKKKGWRDALVDAAEGYQQPPGGTTRFAQRVRTPPTSLRVLCTRHPLLFLNYRKTITLLTPLEISKKIEVRKPKMSLDLRQKKVNPEGYAVIILYKKVKIQKHPSNINCVIFLMTRE